MASQNPDTLANLPAGQFAYGFDAGGNRLTTILDGSTTTIAYNALNQFTNVTGSSAAAIPLQTYSWDANDRLASIHYTGTSNQTLLTYDGRGCCVQAVEMTGATITSTRQFVWDGWFQVKEHDGTGATTKRFFGQGVQIVSGTPAGSYYYTGDHLGSIREMTDSTGTVRALYDYDPSGPTKLAGDLDSDFGFTGLFAHAPSRLNMPTGPR
ncbi:MAG: hypothetical protein JWO94_2953 [Verrucomicrobiaceae bacterium]|nr:hypothetical protein [Verrucomicrobiaceae bacterium]